MTLEIPGGITARGDHAQGLRARGEVSKSDCERTSAGRVERRACAESSPCQP